MRSYGEVDGVQFTKKHWCISNLATKVIISYDGDSKCVYVDDMKQLREEIQTFKQELNIYEENQIQVRSLSDFS